MKVLAIETAAEYCSVALWIDGTVDECHVESPARHTEVLLPSCEELCRARGIACAALDGIGFGAGPGAFTGVRVAASAAQGIALAHALPVVAVSSLAALAHGGWRCNGLPHQLALLDARRQEVYWGLYRLDDAGRCTTLHADCVSAPEAVLIDLPRPCGVVGRGYELLPATVRAQLAPDAIEIAQCRFPRARDVAALAVFELAADRGRAPEHALPVYLRGAV